MQHLTATYVQDFFTGVSKAEEGKLSVFLKALADATVEEVRQVTKEVAATSDTLKTRMSEVRQIWGALHQIPDFKLDSSIGYNKASDASRKALAEAKITWQGKPVLDKGQRASKRAEAIAVGMAAKAFTVAHGDVSKMVDALPGVKIEQAISELIATAQQTSMKYGLTLDELEQACTQFLTWMKGEIGNIRAGVREEPALKAA